MFGYFTASEQPATSAASNPAAASQPAPSKPAEWTTRDTMSILYVVAAVFAIVITIVTGHDLNLPPMPEVDEKR